MPGAHTTSHASASAVLPAPRHTSETPDVPCDAVIVGAGPAGATCAWFLARAGYRVVVVDQAMFPREKPCGDAISRTKALPILDAMGLADAVETLEGGRCTELAICSSRGAPLRIPAPAAAANRWQAHVICPRQTFDARLLDHVRPIVEVREGFTVTGLLRQQHRVVGVVGREGGAAGREHRVRASVVVGADGAHSLVARQAGVARQDRRHLGIALRGYVEGYSGPPHQMVFYYLDRLLPGCLWVFPMGEGRANVGIGLLKRDMDRRGDHLVDLFWSAVQEPGALRAAFAHATLRGPLRGWPLTGWHGRRRLSGAGVLLIGDAAWLIDPLTGEGIGNAMVSGQLAAATIADALARQDVSAGALAQYDRRLYRVLGRDLWCKRLLQRLARHRWFIDGVLRVARSHDAFARVIQQLVASPYTQRDTFWSMRGLARAVTACLAPRAA